MDIINIIFGLILGGTLSYLWLRNRISKGSELIEVKEKLQELEMNLKSAEDKVQRYEGEITLTKEVLQVKENQLSNQNAELAVANNQLDQSQKALETNDQELQKEKSKLNHLEKHVNTLTLEKSEIDIKNNALSSEIAKISNRHDLLDKNLEEKSRKYHELHTTLSTKNAENEALKEKLQVQKEEIEELHKKFNLEFQHIANKILEEKTEKFTAVNKKNLESILNPLGENIHQFKKQVEETYNKESKERFSLEEQVKEMAKLNKVISDEARNLTNALKGEARTQGKWGEMILESILEKSGLRKGEEYFLEHQLVDRGGKPLRSDSENKKMRPDALIKYPDNRSVIIDSKVSLNAFSRFLAAKDKADQDRELRTHINAIKNHITTLSSKGYDDYDKALDFVLMFVPSEPAYIAALQGDPDLWNFAYTKRILLINPTNLITALKLIVDLWKREYQNQNALQIAERGAKLYDKFVGFVKNLESVGTHIDNARGKYQEAYKQLSTGNDNLVLQATKLKDLGIKNKKELPQTLRDTVNQAN